MFKMMFHSIFMMCALIFIVSPLHATDFEKKDDSDNVTANLTSSHTKPHQFLHTRVSENAIIEIDDPTLFCCTFIDKQTGEEKDSIGYVSKIECLGSTDVYTYQNVDGENDKNIFINKYIFSDYDLKITTQYKCPNSIIGCTFIINHPHNFVVVHQRQSPNIVPWTKPVVDYHQSQKNSYDNF